MRDPVLPAAMLSLAIGMMLGFAQRRVALLAGVAATVAILLAPFVVATASDQEFLFLTAWLAVATTAACGWLAKNCPLRLTLPIAGCAGGLVGLLSSPRLGPHIVWLVALIAFAAGGARMLVTRGRGLFVSVAAGWLLAVAVLNVGLTMLPVTPGYLPDHLE